MMKLYGATCIHAAVQPRSACMRARARVRRPRSTRLDSCMYGSMCCASVRVVRRVRAIDRHREKPISAAESESESRSVDAKDEQMVLLPLAALYNVSFILHASKIKHSIVSHCRSQRCSFGSAALVRGVFVELSLRLRLHTSQCRVPNATGLRRGFAVSCTTFVGM